MMDCMSKRKSFVAWLYGTNMGVLPDHPRGISDNGKLRCSNEKHEQDWNGENNTGTYR